MHRLLSLIALLASLLALSVPAHAAGAVSGSPMRPEEAFVLSAQALDPQTVEVTVKIAGDYYLYADKFRFRADPDTVSFGTPQRPAGKVTKDDFFGQVETYRKEVKILLPVNAPEGTTKFRLLGSVQGCWDGGICYPPNEQTADIDLLAKPMKTGGNFLDGLLGRDDKPVQAAAATGGSGVSDDESGRIAGLLRDASGPLVLLSFFGFGLLLAFTPCMFPMIPILSGIIVGHGHDISRGRAFVLSLVYVLGMAITYAAAGVAAGLSGTMLAAALQNAWVLGAFALVFVLLSLSMFGFYELQLPTALQSRLSSTASHQQGGSLGGVAVMGVLSALIVGPCVAAPLAGALLYIAQTGNAALGGAALFAMALGMGAPLLAVGVAARSVLPRAGAWMEGVKKAFGVMLLAVAVWLLTPVVPPLLPMLAWAALLVFSGIFLHAIDPLPPHAKGWQRFWKGVGVVLLIGGAAMLIGALAGSRDPLQPLAVLRAQAATANAAELPRFEKVASIAELDARLASTDRPVMLDFYADWCVSCKEMERFTFTDPNVAARMGRMLLLKADVTANNDDDKALLKRFNLFGPPGTIFFDPAGKERDGLRVVGFMKADAFSEVLDRALR
ncbi:protein-disulfide reductase DsbD [Aromatoleum petrolei]|uniref:Thiol:disulfide interchange protein DsbD n=1 Tax=Aromatoleum petrolei TaxID=76116 RepID=A0ABX1MX81_9RHOO|nr:protein-disulfide reductase DsbD [Aromatoleum petrolei]NMF91276.1 protein-disulfide reductase DsbD [Aromatoleum petrolei]QTQ37053.1 Thiol:disulfide interchange protein [Aromatoleum petrolei]